MTDNYDLEMRLAIVGRELEDVVDAEAQHETPVAEPHDSSAPTPPMASSALLETEIENVLSFVPAHIFAKFPQKYISNASQQDYIIEHFFKDIWNRSWDLFYLPLPERQAHQSLILVPQSQAENMLSHINAVVSLKLTLDGMKQDRLVLDFVNLPIPKPLYLGRSNDAEEKKFLQGNIQRMENFAEWDDLAKDNNSLIFRAFTQYLKNVILPTMNCKKARWNSKRRAKMAKMAKWTSQLNWLLSCLGLRPPPASESSPNGDQQSVLAPVNVLMAPEWDFHNNPVFVSIDCEWMERSSWALTEVGISILDTHDLVNLPPGDYGENWKKRIRSYHLRVSEHESHINQEFCLGCPDKFEWGQSYLIDHDHMGVTIDHYLSSHGAGRNLILVGLAMDHDLQILRRTGSVYFSQPEGAMFNDRLDVAYLFRALRNIDVHHGMARLLGELNELHSEWLHNAGNDARYTMHALVRIAMEAAGEKQESEMEVVD